MTVALAYPPPSTIAAATIATPNVVLISVVSLVFGAALTPGATIVSGFPPSLYGFVKCDVFGCGMQLGYAHAGMNEINLFRDRGSPTKPFERFPPAAEILVVQIIAVAAIEIIVAVEWIACVCGKTKTISVKRSGT